MLQACRQFAVTALPPAPPKSGIGEIVQFTTEEMIGTPAGEFLRRDLLCQRRGNLEEERALAEGRFEDSHVRSKVERLNDCGRGRRRRQELAELASVRGTAERCSCGAESFTSPRLTCAEAAYADHIGRSVCSSNVRRRPVEVIEQAVTDLLQRNAATRVAFAFLHPPSQLGMHFFFGDLHPVGRRALPNNSREMMARSSVGVATRR